MKKLTVITPVMLVLGSVSALADPLLQATFAKTTAKGDSSITIRAEVPGISPNTTGASGVKISPVTNIYDSNGHVISERVDITISIAQGSNALSKANQVGAGLKLAFGPTVGRDPSHPNDPTVIMPSGSTFSVVNGKDTTGEGQVQIVAMGGVPANGQIIEIGWNTDPAGMDANGSASTFTASFGYDGLNDSATIDSSQLSSLTLSSLTAAMYAALDANLPVSLRSDLTMDTQDYGLTFRIPDGSMDPFITDTTTDVATAPWGGLDDFQTPEPANLALCGLGAITLLACFRRWHSSAP